MDRAYHELACLIGFPVMTAIKKVNRIFGGRIPPESNHAADRGNGIGSLSSLHSCITLMLIADSVKRLSSEAANSKATSTTSPSMSAAYTISALFSAHLSRRRRGELIE